MVDILFVVPYPELEPVVQEVYREYPKKEGVGVEFKVMTVDMVRQYTPEREYDVLVGRNFTMEELKRQYPAKPVVNIPITGYDIVQALYEAKRLYQCRKVGIVGRFFHMYQYENMEDITGVSTAYYPVDQSHDLKACVENAMSQDCDCIIGGYSTFLYLREGPVPVVTIKVSRETIYNTLEEAVHIGEEIKREQERSEMFRIITQTANSGIFYINEKWQIEIANREARKLFPAVKTGKGYRYLRQVASFMEEDAEKCFETGKQVTDKLYIIEGSGGGGLSLSADFIPVKIGEAIPGMVISFMNVTRIQQMEGQIRRQMSEKGLTARYTFKDIIHKSTVLEKTIETAERYARVFSNILLVGETGTGKELFAQSIHNASSRAHNGFVAVNCAALPENLLESELFGYVEGAFTGSKKGGKMGLFELAHRGTLFLDEISEVPLAVQVKLLRVLQEREVRRVGGDAVISVDVRIIAATNKNLKKLVSEGKFREDLLYRLDVLRLYIPPLRKRREDIPLLFHYYLQYYSNRFGYTLPLLSQEAEQVLGQYPFTGNIRELRNIAERLSVVHCGFMISGDEMIEALGQEEIELSDRGEQAGPGAGHRTGVAQRQEQEKQYIQHMLSQYDYNRNETARAMGIDRSTLWRKMKKYGLQ